MKVKWFTLLAALVVTIAFIGCQAGEAEVGEGIGAQEEEPGQVGEGFGQDEAETGQADATAGGGLFSDWDIDNSGTLDRNQFQAGIAQSGLFDQWDADGSGTIEEAELESAWGTDTLGVQDVGPSEAFNQWDTDGDGTLNENELSAGLFDTLDTDGDGQLTEEEFRDFETTLR